MKCRNCQGLCIKKGCQNKKQKYFCKSCELYQQKTYTYKLCTKKEEQTIIDLNRIGVGISGISSFTGMSKANVIRKIRILSSSIIFGEIKEIDQEYEVDELCTYVGRKSNRCYITYAMNKRTRQIIALIVGRRTKDNVGRVIMRLKELKPKKIYTDKLNIYPTLIDKDIHVIGAHKINHIERFNLTLRTHLKRLSRKTICFSKSAEMLENCLKLYICDIQAL